MPRDTENRDPLIALRIPPALDQRLRAHAATTGATLSEIVRDAITATLERDVKPAGLPTGAKRARDRRVTGVCEHRVRVGNYCRRCDGVI